MGEKISGNLDDPMRTSGGSIRYSYHARLEVYVPYRYCTRKLYGVGKWGHFYSRQLLAPYLSSIVNDFALLVIDNTDVRQGCVISYYLLFYPILC